MDKNKLHNLDVYGSMTDAERIAFLERLLENEEEIEQLASMELVKMPEYLEEEILEAILAEEQQGNAAVQQSEPQQSVSYQKFRPPKWLELFAYSVKISFAAACAIVALFRMPELAVQNSERMAVEWEQETLAKEAEAAKRQQEVLAQKEERRQRGSLDSGYIAGALEFITNKIFVGGIEND